MSTGISQADVTQPAYIKVADAVAARIQAGELTLRLPSERELTRQYGVAYLTVRHAMRVLRERGLIITRQGRGTFVAAAVRSASLRECQ
jgi:GntR family transcriptional regulator